MTDNISIENKASFPQLLTVTDAPHIKHISSTRGIMIDVLIALLPATIWGCYVFGLRAALICAIGIVSSVLFELIVQLVLHRPVTIGDFSAAVTGLLLSLNLPSTVSLWVPVVGSAFAIIVVKQLYGGIGKNVVNPALAARVFIFVSWPSQITNFVSPFDNVAQATPLTSLKNGSLPSSSLFDMFFGNIGGCIGEVSVFLLLIGCLYLLFRKVITLHIPLTILATVALLCIVFPQIPAVTDFAAIKFSAYELCSGGLMLGSIFMATDYVTCPVTKKGKIIYGVGIGAITVFLRFFGGFPEGVSFAILIMNLTVYYLDKFCAPAFFGKIKSRKS